MKKLSLPVKTLIFSFIAFIAIGLSFYRTSYVGEVTCKIRSDYSFLGIKIFSREIPGREGAYLASLVGDIPEHKYTESSSGSVIFGGSVVGTPAGNWLWVHHLIEYERDKELPREKAVELAIQLISKDETIRQEAIEQIVKWSHRGK